MSWYDFGRSYNNFMECLPTGKTLEETGFKYHELCAMGGWYFKPVKGSGQRRFHNRWYINPTVEEKELFNLDDVTTMFIQLGKTKFGDLIIRCSPALTDEENNNLVVRWMEYFMWLRERIHESWIVLYHDGRGDTAEWFSCKDDAMEFMAEITQKTSLYLRKKYGVKLFAPNADDPELNVMGVVG